MHPHTIVIAATLGALTLLPACSSSEGAPAVETGPGAFAPAPSEPPAAPSDGPPRPAPSRDAGPPREEQGPPAVQLVGRFDERGSEGPVCAWPGCRIVARFEGTEVKVRLREIQKPWMAGGPSEWDVAVDGVWQPKLVLAEGEQEVVLATGLPPGEHQIELYKRSEAQNGATQLLGFDFGPGGALLPPPPRRARRIEIVGDSQPAAFGVEGVGFGPDCPGEDYAARWQSFRRSFGARLGERFEAEVQGTVYSGKGIVRNIWRPDTETMPVLYGRSNPLEAASRFDPSSYVPDAIVVMLGGNDFAIGQPYDDGTPPLAEFTAGYDAFVGTLRGHYPQAHIFLATSPSVSDVEPAGRQSRTSVLAAVRAVVEGRNAGGDARVHEATASPAQKSELTGCNGHGSPAFHDRVAAELAAIVGPALGWDQ